MTKRSKAMILTAVLVAGGVAAAAAFGRGGHGHHDGHAGLGRAEHLAEHLDLDDTQRAELEAIVESARLRLEEQRETLKESRRALHELFRSGTAGEATVRPLAEAQGEAMAELIVQRALVMAQVQALLTPDQQAELEEMWEHRGEHGRRHGKGRHHGWE